MGFTTFKSQWETGNILESNKVAQKTMRGFFFRSLFRRLSHSSTVLMSSSASNSSYSHWKGVLVPLTVFGLAAIADAHDGSCGNFHVALCSPPTEYDEKAFLRGLRGAVGTDNVETDSSELEAR